MNWDQRIFLAHANEDKYYVRKFYRRLKEEGLEPWLDEEDMQPGDKWADVAIDAVRKSGIFLAIISKNSVNKDGFVQRELRYALQEMEKKAPGSIYFIPVLIDDIELPNITVGTITLNDYHAVKLEGGNGFDKLVKALKDKLKVDESEQPLNFKIFEEARDFLAASEAERAIKLLVELAKREEKYERFYNSLIINQSQLAGLSKNALLGIVSNSDKMLTMNRINHAILEILHGMEQV